MSKATKIWLIVAAALVLLGVIVLGGAFALVKGDVFKLTTHKYETNIYEITEEFDSIFINTDTADIVFVSTDEENCKIVCYEEEKMKHSVGVTDGKLSVGVVNTKKWYDYINLGWNTDPMITVHLPKSDNISISLKNSTGKIELPSNVTFESIDIVGSTGDVICRSSADGTIKIKRSTGDILLENISSGALDLWVSTGDVKATSVNCAGDVKLHTSTGYVKLESFTCKNLSSECDTGDITLKNVVATEMFDIETDTGKVIFDRCDANEMFVNTDTGNVTGTLLTDKIFYVKSDTGKVEVPRSVNGGKCEIETDTGNVKISIVN